MHVHVKRDGSEVVKIDKTETRYLREAKKVCDNLARKLDDNETPSKISTLIDALFLQLSGNADAKTNSGMQAMMAQGMPY
jgi:hypothetical protein